MIEKPKQQTDDESKALARKRRIELRSKKRHSDEEHGEKRVCIRDDDYYTVVPDDVSSVLKKPSIRGIKKQARYDPGISMTKEELVAWRKEARRVRNRESAAESRTRTRNRIDELESEMDVLKTKYSAALQRIVELEAAAAVHDAISPLTLHQDASIVSPSSSPQHFPTPTMTPEDSFTLSDKERHHQEAAQNLPAAKITGADAFAHPFDNPAPPPSISECSLSEVSELSSETSTEELDDHELAGFLFDAFTDFDPHQDLMDLCV